MKKLVFVAKEAAISAIFVFVAFAASTFAAFEMDRFLCGDANGSQAAGGGAAIGMLVLFCIGAPTVVFCALTETSRALFAMSWLTRLVALATPTVLGSFYMYWVLKTSC